VTVGGSAIRLACRLAPDPGRVLAQLFVPGHTDHAMREGRVEGVVARVLEMDDHEVDGVLAELVSRFGGRHRDLEATFRHHADRVAARMAPGLSLTAKQRLALGAAFTQEYAVEAAALCNPSMVEAPDQSDAADGAVRFIMSVRQIGEGHRSSIGFRSGSIGPGGTVTVDAPAPLATAATVTRGCVVTERLRASGQDDALEWVLDGLDPICSMDELEARIAELEDQSDTRSDAAATAARLRGLTERFYTASFDPSVPLGERVLYPAAAVESAGIEDARFVRLVDDDGAVAYHATYTAFDGRSLTLQLLTTTDFRDLDASPLFGRAATNKGLALFPRRVGGRYAALSRHDGASNAVAFTDDLRHWPDAVPIRHPVEIWESVQAGNCGSPIETDAGWLVLTHGVGPMRTYSLGAWLLDLDRPEVLLGRLRSPLLSPLPEEQNGYVPNVVYSCGSLVHDGTVVIPFGIADASVGFATIGLDDLLGLLT
jgi:predicted GH43/DUF377 family glycosyl hydrolase